jgi:hypothetical protein
MSNPSTIECANIGTENARQALIAYRSVSEKTGVPVAEVARLMLTGESRSLFGADGMLRSREELRNLSGGRDPKAALADLRKKRPGIDGRQAVDELKAKRLSWT